MKEAIIKVGPKIEIVDSPVPKAGAGQVVIKVEVSGSNPKDWKYPEWAPEKAQINQGDDIAGTIHEVGSGVTEFKVGDRVAAFHEMLAPHGSYAEYAVAHAYTTFHIPDSFSYEEAAALPLAGMTAAIGLFHHLNLALPAPWETQTTIKKKIPLVVYGGAAAIGAYAIQLARRAGIHPIIAIAGRGQDYVEKLIDRSRGDTIVDYRKGNDAVISGVKQAAKAAGVDDIYHAFDGVTTDETQENIFKMLSPGGRITTNLPSLELPTPEGIYGHATSVGIVHGAGPDVTDEDRDFGEVYFRYIARGVERGWFKAHNTQVVPGGLNGVEGALKELKAGKASAVKYVFRIADTPGVGLAH